MLICHLHGDHLHLPSLRRLPPSARIVVPRGAGGLAARPGLPRVEELSAGEELVDGDLRVTGVRAEHSGHRCGPRSTHGPQPPRDRPPAGGGRQHASTPPATPTCSTAWPRSGRVDVALLPVWGWGPDLGPGHLDPARAADAVALLRPRVVVPVHWGTLAVAGLTAVPSGRRARMRRLLVDPPRVFAADGRRRRARARTSPSPSPALAVRLPGGAREPPRRGLDWTDPASIGYPPLGAGVLLGSIVPGGADRRGGRRGRRDRHHHRAPLAACGDRRWPPWRALAGDLVTFAAGRAGSGPRRCGWSRAASTPSGSTTCASSSAAHGWQIIVVGRLLPAGRIPVLLAAAALAYPWRRLVPAAAVGCLLWAIAYAVLGVRQRRHLRLDPLVATLLATVLVLVVAAVLDAGRARCGGGSAT